MTTFSQRSLISLVTSLLVIALVETACGLGSQAVNEPPPSQAPTQAPTTVAPLPSATETPKPTTDSAPTYSLQTKVPLGAAGSIKVEPPPDQSGTYRSGTPVTLYASANPGFSFKQWVQGPKGENFGAQNPLTVTITSDLNIAAIFAKNTAVGKSWTWQRAGQKKLLSQKSSVSQQTTLLPPPKPQV